jgi:hypothetical protein
MHVSEIMPHMSDNMRRMPAGQTWIIHRICAIIVKSISLFALDKVICEGVFILTYLTRPSREENQNTSGRSQAHRLAPLGHPPSPSRADHRSALCSARLFRSSRHAPGQIRNAPLCADRGPIHQPHHQSVWLLSAHLLPGFGCLHRRWPGRFIAAEAGTTAGPQALRGDPGLCRSTARQRGILVHRPSPPADLPAIRFDRPSSQSRTRSEPTQKKTPALPQGRHCHGAVRPLIWWLPMRPYEARFWELRPGPVATRDGLCWSVRGWLPFCPRRPRPSQHRYSVRAPLRRESLRGCNPNSPISSSPWSPTITRKQPL